MEKNERNDIKFKLNKIEIPNGELEHDIYIIYNGETAIYKDITSTGFHLLGEGLSWKIKEKGWNNEMLLCFLAILRAFYHHLIWIFIRLKCSSFMWMVRVIFEAVFKDFKPLKELCLSIFLFHREVADDYWCVIVIRLYYCYCIVNLDNTCLSSWKFL